MKKLTLCLVLIFAVSMAFVAEGAGSSVMIYSSMKDSQLAALKQAFSKKYPDIKMDYYSAGTGKVMTKIATEQQAGGIRADVIWVGEPTNYVEFKQQGILLKYDSPEAKTISKLMKDKDGYYCSARLVALGFVYNTNLVKGKDIPKKWADLTKPRFKGVVCMTDPSFSGTTLYTVAGLVQNSKKFGWDYLQKLKNNDLKLVKGSSDVINKTAVGEYDCGIGADYIAKTVMDQGSPVGFVYPEDGIPVVASPIAIVKNSKNIAAAKKLFDFILSLEGQKVLLDNDLTPVRPEIEVPGLSIEAMMKRAIPVDDELLIKEKDAMIKKFDSIFKK